MSWNRPTLKRSRRTSREQEVLKEDGHQEQIEDALRAGQIQALNDLGLDIPVDPNILDSSNPVFSTQSNFLYPSQLQQQLDHSNFDAHPDFPYFERDPVDRLALLRMLPLPSMSQLLGVEGGIGTELAEDSTIGQQRNANARGNGENERSLQQETISPSILEQDSATGAVANLVRDLVPKNSIGEVPQVSGPFRLSMTAEGRQYLDGPVEGATVDQNTTGSTYIYIANYRPGPLPAVDSAVEPGRNALSSTSISSVMTTESKERRGPRRCGFCGKTECRGRGGRTWCPDYQALSIGEKGHNEEDEEQKEPTEGEGGTTTNPPPKPKLKTYIPRARLRKSVVSAAEKGIRSTSTDVLPDPNVEIDQLDSNAAILSLLESAQPSESEALPPGGSAIDAVHNTMAVGSSHEVNLEEDDSNEEAREVDELVAFEMVSQTLGRSMSPATGSWSTGL